LACSAIQLIPCSPSSSSSGNTTFTESSVMVPASHCRGAPPAGPAPSPPAHVVYKLVLLQGASSDKELFARIAGASLQCAAACVSSDC
jgi:hypothetical protein